MGSGCRESRVEPWQRESDGAAGESFLKSETGSRTSDLISMSLSDAAAAVLQQPRGVPARTLVDSRHKVGWRDSRCLTKLRHFDEPAAVASSRENFANYSPNYPAAAVNSNNHMESARPLPRTVGRLPRSSGASHGRLSRATPDDRSTAISIAVE